MFDPSGAVEHPLAFTVGLRGCVKTNVNKIVNKKRYLMYTVC